MGVQVVDFGAPRFRCPRCRATATALPEDVVPGLAHGVDAVAAVVAGYLDGKASYRRLAPAMLGLPTRPAITLEDHAEPPYPSPTPSTCFRWVARAGASARAWWRAALPLLLTRQAYAPPAVPAYFDGLAKSPSKRAGLADAWRALEAWRLLADHVAVPRSRWPNLQRTAPHPPAGLDRTGWFQALAMPP